MTELFGNIPFGRFLHNWRHFYSVCHSSLSSGGRVRKSYGLRTGFPGFLTSPLQNYDEVCYRELLSEGKIESQLHSNAILP